MGVLHPSCGEASRRFDASCSVLPAEETLQAARGDCGLKGRAFCPVVVADLAKESLVQLVGLSLRLQGFGQYQPV